MNLKIIVLIGAIVGMILLSLFSFGIKEIAVKGIADDISEYNCYGDFCTSCMIEGHSCSCREEVCDCGEKTVDKKECSLLS